MSPRLLVVFGVLAVSALAAESSPKVQASIRIDAPMAEVWKILADYGSIHRYTKTVTDTQILGGPREGVGCTRKCVLPGKGGRNYVEEKIVEFLPASRLTYIVTATNAPIEDGKLSWALTEDGAVTRLTASLWYRPKHGPLGGMMDAMMMKSKFRANISTTLAELKRAAETRRDATR